MTEKPHWMFIILYIISFLKPVFTKCKGDNESEFETTKSPGRECDPKKQRGTFSQGDWKVPFLTCRTSSISYFLSIILISFVISGPIIDRGALCNGVVYPLLSTCTLPRTKNFASLPISNCVSKLLVLELIKCICYWGLSYPVHDDMD